MYAREITEQIIGGAMTVDDELGPGLLESTYEACLCYELTCRGLKFQRQLPLPVHYRSVRVDCGYRIDLFVEGLVILELKSIERFERVHTAQMLTYLKLTGCRLGLLINFNVPLLKDGIRRIIL